MGWTTPSRLHWWWKGCKCFSFLMACTSEDFMEVTTRWHCDEEGLPAALFPEETEEVQHEHQNPHKLLQTYHQKPPDRLRHRVVWELFQSQLESTTESNGNGTAHHWKHSSNHSRHIPQMVAVKETQHHTGSEPRSTQTVLHDAV